MRFNLISADNITQCKYLLFIVLLFYGLVGLDSKLYLSNKNYILSSLA